MTDTSTKAWSIESFAVEPEEGRSAFDFGLPKALISDRDLGFLYASPLQGEALPVALNGEDIVASRRVPGSGCFSNLNH